MASLLNYALILVLFWLGSCTSDDHVNLVRTNFGPVDGVSEVGRTGKKSFAYYAIPYAEAPIGDLRFKPPVGLSQVHEEIFHADKKIQGCYQTPAEGITLNYPWGPESEDCLKLNIWVPDPMPQNAPVLVYIHDGGFNFGFLNMVNGSLVAPEANVIAVSVAYRLGPFGFLSLGSADAPGNVGLMDQQMAMKWVHDNIHAFGGDPNRVTLIGANSAAASVGYHVLSDGSYSLFHRAIMASGVPTCKWAFHLKDSVVRKSKQIAADLGYHGDDDPAHIAEYLRSKEPQELIGASTFSDLVNDDVLGPTVDGTFLKNYPHLLMEEAANNNDIEILIGTKGFEGTELLSEDYTDNIFRRHSDGRISREEFVQIVKSMNHRVMNDFVAMATTRHYLDFENLQDPWSIRDGAIKAFGDYSTTCVIEQFADYFVSTNHTVYRFVFDDDQPIYHAPWYRTVASPELQNQTMYKKFAMGMVRQIGNFVAKGDPNSDADQNGVHWPKYDLKDRAVFLMGFLNKTVQNHPGAEQCFFMRSIRPVLSKYTRCRQGDPTDELIAEAAKSGKKSRILDEMLADLISVSLPKPAKPWFWALS